MLVCRRGSDAIDHAIWKYAVLSQPVPKNGISQLGEGRQHLLGNFTVALDVVARHQRERRKPPCTPAIEGLQEISKRTAGFMRVSEIILNVRMLLVQIPGRLVDIVSTFRNRKRNNPGLGDAICSITFCGSSVANRKLTIEPMIRALSPSKLRSTSV